MHVVIRTYSGQGASAVLETLEQQKEEVQALISEVPGFVSYAAVRTAGGWLTVTVCQDKAGTDESSRRAADFIKDKVTATASPPAITQGETVLQFNA